jgi:hypothetical protein
VNSDACSRSCSCTSDHDFDPCSTEHLDGHAGLVQACGGDLVTVDGHDDGQDQRLAYGHVGLVDLDDVAHGNLLLLAASAHDRYTAVSFVGPNTLVAQSPACDHRPRRGRRGEGTRTPSGERHRGSMVRVRLSPAKRSSLAGSSLDRTCRAGVSSAECPAGTPATTSPVPAPSDVGRRGWPGWAAFGAAPGAGHDAGFGRRRCWLGSAWPGFGFSVLPVRPARRSARFLEPRARARQVSSFVPAVVLGVSTRPPSTTARRSTRSRVLVGVLLGCSWCRAIAAMSSARAVGGSGRCPLRSAPRLAGCGAAPPRSLRLDRASSTTTPRPWHCGQSWENDSRRPVPIRFRHLHEAERGDLGDLVPRTVAAETSTSLRARGHGWTRAPCR